MSTEAHDERYYSMPQAVFEIQDKKAYDNLRIFGRTLFETSGRMEQQVLLVTIIPANPVEALLQERNRPFTLEEIRYYQKEVERVENLMRMRNAPKEEIVAFRNLFLPGANKITQKKGKKI